MHTVDIFENMASRYDTEDRIKMAAVIAEQIRNEIADVKEKTALDYGCGTGLIGLALMDLFDSMWFVDASNKMIAQVDRKIEQYEHENVYTLCSDFCVHIPSLHVDYVLVSQTLLHVKDYELLLNRFYDILHADGHLIIVDFDKNERVKTDMVHNGFHQLELTQKLEQIGFENITSKTFYGGKNIFMKQDASLFILNAKK